MNSLFAFICGLYFALLQFSYFFMMEAYLSSQFLAYFITLLFWLVGFLTGLNITRQRLFAGLLLLGIAAYYTAWILVKVVPFHGLLYPSAALCSILSGLLPGYFFPVMARRAISIPSMLFHENNGFLLGILLALKGSIYCGSWFLAWAPLLGLMLVGGLLLLYRGRGEVEN